MCYESLKQKMSYENLKQKKKFHRFYIPFSCYHWLFNLFYSSHNKLFEFHWNNWKKKNETQNR